MTGLTLDDSQLAQVLSILKAQLPGVEVWAFGSRVTGNAKPYSDLDLALLTTTPLALATLADLRDAFDTSDLPIRVDLVDWADASDSFRALIERNHVRLIP